MTTKKPRITSAIILQHMQGMEQRLTGEMKGIKEDVVELQSDVRGLKSGMNQLNKKVDLLSAQIENIDKRLDDVEIIQVPRLKKAVGIS